MFCNQCEQTSKGIACTQSGVCGKTSSVAHLQDSIVHALRALASTAHKARAKGLVRESVDDATMRALFTTLTNVNFDEAALKNQIRTLVILRKELAKALGCTPNVDDEAVDKTVQTIIDETPHPDQMHPNPDICSAMQLLLYGLKGLAAYADHAAVLGKRDPELAAFVYKALVAGMPHKNGQPDTEYTLAQWLDLVLECGNANLRAMELLEAGNTEHFGHPTPTKVSLGQRPGKAILVSGHDLEDLHALLEQTAGTGINVYTHGEMLPAHGYPTLNAFSHLAGHFGTAWQNQRTELKAFPGAVLFTTNCIQNPGEYSDKVFTSGATGWPGLTHCHKSDFGPLIAKALSMPGFKHNLSGQNTLNPAGGEQAQSVLVGFGRQTLLTAAPAVLDAVQSGAIRHIFLVGGCDGAKPGRNYYTEFVEQTPKDTLVLTLACGKFRFFDKALGSIGAFPRLMDVGQCNDAYAAVQVALALAEALHCTVNDLPLSLVLSWYEQKAVSILLSLLALGVKNIRLGPSLPAFVSPAILELLIKEWGIAPITTPEADLQAILGMH